MASTLPDSGDAWAQCWGGEADPSKIGIEFNGMRGLWFVAGSMAQGVAALNRVEMLSWDVWGGQPRPDEALDDDWLAYFDRIAALTCELDASCDKLRSTFEADERLRVPAMAFNSLLNRSERI